MKLESYQPQERYFGKAGHYDRFRPSYPPATTRLLRSALGTEHGGDVADVGSGTGIFSSLLLDAGFRVYGVEPNPHMRHEAETKLNNYAGFTSIAAVAEATGLSDACVDAVVCAQAFHWFDARRVVPEFRRILRRWGVIGLIWNNQRFGVDAFHSDYEKILQRGCSDYRAFDLSSISYSVERLRQEFETELVVEHRFENRQTLTLEGFQGRISSVSYCPAPSSLEYAALMQEVEALFEKYQRDGCVQIYYDVVMYCIQFNSK